MSVDTEQGIKQLVLNDAVLAGYLEMSDNPDLVKDQTVEIARESLEKNVEQVYETCDENQEDTTLNGHNRPTLAARFGSAMWRGGVKTAMVGVGCGLLAKDGLSHLVRRSRPYQSIVSTMDRLKIHMHERHPKYVDRWYGICAMDRSSLDSFMKDMSDLASGVQDDLLKRMGPHNDEPAGLSDATKALWKLSILNNEPLSEYESKLRGVLSADVLDELKDIIELQKLDPRLQAQAEDLEQKVESSAEKAKTPPTLEDVQASVEHLQERGFKGEVVSMEELSENVQTASDMQESSVSKMAQAKALREQADALEQEANAQARVANDLKLQTLDADASGLLQGDTYTELNRNFINGLLPEKTDDDGMSL